MLFNSFPFLIFFLSVTGIYYTLNRRWQLIWLLAASCYFYAFLIPAYLLILFLIILIDYSAALFIESAEKKNRRRFFLALSIIGNLGVLSLFKYHNFFVENVNLVAGNLFHSGKLFSIWNLALPVGLSFHTFQAMSYTIEVYRRNQKAEKKLHIYALYVMFYPQLVAGPIERPQKLLPQFYQNHKINYDNLAAGLKLILQGLFMKVVVADRLAIYVDYVFRNADAHGRLALITATFFYSFQIYCDFAGYSLIALGAAKSMGFSLSKNFNRPYLASSAREFWKRWNITLSQWFRDYVYFPMGGSRVTISKYIFNILVVFILSGLWHGASWTFIIWGLLHAVFLLTDYFRKKFTPSIVIPKAAGIISTYLVVSFCWIFFRSRNVSEAINMIKRIFDPKTPGIMGKEFDERSLLVYSLLGIGSVMLMDMISEFFPDRFQLLHSRRSWVE